MREFKYATVSYEATTLQLSRRGIEVECDMKGIEKVERTGLFLGVAHYGDDDGADTYLMVIDGQTGFVMEVDPSKVRFILDKGVCL